MTKSKMIYMSDFYDNPTEETYKQLKDQLDRDLVQQLIPFWLYEETIYLLEKHLTENS